jgi:3-oxoadipate enol-lactonase
VPTLPTAGGDVAYADTGPPPDRPGAPTVVFGHGLLFSGWMFRHQVAALRDTYRCVTVDWRGQGDSPPSAAGYDMDSLAADARALIEHLAVGAVHYVGLSMGGFVGMRLGARHPELLRSLTLLDTSARREDRRAAVEDTVLAHIYRLFGMRPVRGPAAKIMFGPTFRAGPDGDTVINELMDRIGRLDRKGLVGAILAVARRVGVLEEIGSVTAPTLVIVGEDDRPTPVERAREIAATIPGARLEIVPQCGHSSPLEQPERVTALISEFLTTVDAAPVD